MITAAEQYRTLVAKLESINPSEPISEAQLAYGTTASAEVPAQTGEPAAAPAPAADPNAIQTIEAPTFNQAYAKAKALKLKKFKWCGVYAVKDTPVVRPPVQPKPSAPAPGKVDYTNQPSPLGGDAQNPMSFAPNSNFGA